MTEQYRTKNWVTEIKRPLTEQESSIEVCNFHLCNIEEKTEPIKVQVHGSTDKILKAVNLAAGADTNLVLHTTEGSTLVIPAALLEKYVVSINPT